MGTFLDFWKGEKLFFHIFLPYLRFFFWSVGKKVSPRCQPWRSRGKREVCQTGWSVRGTKLFCFQIYRVARELESQFQYISAQVLSDKVKRKQYDMYGEAGFDLNRAKAGQHQYYRASGATLDPEELFRKIFGDFTKGMGFVNINSMFDQRMEVTRYILILWHISLQHLFYKCAFSHYFT